MRLYLKNIRSGISAEAEYDFDKRRITVLKGSALSKYVSEAKTYKAAYSIKKKRDETVKDGILITDIEFKSVSAAAGFVTGYSTNGMNAWKNKEGMTIKEMLHRIEECG